MSDFEPTKYLIKLKGKQYLEVKYRIQWLRELHPDAIIRTELVNHQPMTTTTKQGLTAQDGLSFAVFKATVILPSGGEATGYGSEEADDFGDYLEKAETKAIGRALAALGFGTQFCEDHDFSADAKREDFKVVDAPVTPKFGGFRKV